MEHKLKTKCCDFCGESFEYKRYERRFCNKSCQNEGQKAQTGELNSRFLGSKTLTCEYCGTSFERQINATRGTRFCSHDCYGKWLKGKDKADVYKGYKPMKRIEFICKTCGMKFKDRVTAIRQFCSNKCREQSQVDRLHTREVVEKRIKYGKIITDPEIKKVYSCWNSIKMRCNNPNNCNYSRYGAKGISICKVWDSSFASFLEDMGIPPSAKHSIDRIDNNGNYEPGNCRWATQQEQCNNTSRNVYITFNGNTHTLIEWSRVTGIKEGTMQSRYNRGWSPERMITTPTNKYNCRRV